MKRLLTLLLFFNTMLLLLQAQPMHQIKGTVIDKNSRQPLEFINVMIIGLNKGSVTNAEGRFTIEQVPPGIYRLQASAIGYKSVTTSEYILSTKNLNIPIEMEENLTELEGVTITASPFRRDVESPVSLRIIGIQEIEKSPGANRDISRIVQSYPGVAFSPIGYRNDLIVRGGAPSENRFYLDGVEIPNINHFSTQGASGGPVGILNADLIREVNFYTGAFPADKGNALSSVLDFKLRDGDMERNSLKATLGASEVSLASNGHIGKKTSYLVSVRQSYLQFLFDMLDLPFLPTFTDAQFKLKTRFNEQNELTVLGLGGIDNMRLNTKADSEDNEYILSYLPKIKQETFTVGAVYRHYAGAHVQSAVVSHSYLNNRNTKYRRNDESHPDNLMLRLRSTEQETKLRLENSTTFRNWKINLGVNLDYSQYTNTTFQRVYTNQPQTFDYHTYLGILRWGLFGTINYTSMDDRFTASLGLRADANDYSSTMKNLSDQLSPRLSLSYQLADHWFASGNAGLYYQLPAYTALGFKNSLALAFAYAKENPKVRGKTSLDRLLRENKELKVIPIKTEDVSQFKEYARQYGVLFAVIKDKSAQGEKVDIMFKAEDVSKLNRIYEQMGYNIPKAQGQTDRKKASARNPQGPELRVPEKGSMTYDKRPSVRMKIDHYRAVAKAISETQKALQKGTKEAVTKEAR